jgi:hypothetical protein
VVERGAADWDLERYRPLAVGEGYAGEEAFSEALTADSELCPQEVELDLHTLSRRAGVHLKSKTRDDLPASGYAVGVEKAQLLVASPSDTCCIRCTLEGGTRVLSLCGRTDPSPGLIGRSRACLVASKCRGENDAPSPIMRTLEQIVMTARPHRKQRILTSKGSTTVRFRHRASGLVRPCSVVIAATTALALAPTNAFSGTNKPITAPTPTQSRTLVTYTGEGGLFFRYTSLIVSARGQSTVAFNKCVVRFRLDTTFWKRLKTALKRTNLHALTGDYPPPPGAADEITEVITVGHDTVRITDFASIPEKMRQELEPLVTILREIVTVGERRMPPSCSSKRTVNGAG